MNAGTRDTCKDYPQHRTRYCRLLLPLPLLSQLHLLLLLHLLPLLLLPSFSFSSSSSSPSFQVLCDDLDLNPPNFVPAIAAAIQQQVER